MNDYIICKTPFMYVCRDCGYEGCEIIAIAVNRERTEVRCPKCGSKRVHVPLEKV